jgi:hypothetical protein
MHALFTFRVEEFVLIFTLKIEAAGGVTSQKAAGTIFNAVRTADLSVLPNITRGLGLRWIHLAEDGWVAATYVNTAMNFSAP